VYSRFQATDRCYLNLSPTIHANYGNENSAQV